MMVRSRAPVRICDIGGWTDTHFAKRGAVLNIAVDLYAHCLLRQREQPRQKHTVYGYRTYEDMGHNGVTLRALDLGTELEISDVQQIEYDGNLDLLKAAVKRVGAANGLDVTVWADAPPGCGVGTSAAVAVALIDALSLFTGGHMVPHEIAALAQQLESEELGLECGVQDQFAAAYGGICFMEIEYPEVSLSQLDVGDETLRELEERLVLVYVGQSRLSDAVHRRVIEGYRSGERQVAQALDMLRQTPYEMKDALLSGSLADVADAMNRNWEAQKLLHPSIANDVIERAFEVAISSGACGGKANGAGGGGSITFLAKPGREVELREALIHEANCEILPARISPEGTHSWLVPEPESRRSGDRHAATVESAPLR